MSVKLRLKRTGRTHRSVFRLGAVESRNPRDGRMLEELGVYDPANKNADQQLRFDGERVRYWLERGAVPSDTVKHLLKRMGIAGK